MILGRILNKIKRNLAVIGKPMTMHVEAIYVDDVWEKVKKLVEEKPSKIKIFFSMTPANYDYLKSAILPEISKSEMSKKMKERYSWLISKNQRVELHVHSSMLGKTKDKEQEELILESIKWFKENLGYRPKMFVPGWWKYTDKIKNILEKEKIIPVKYTDYDFVHDYEL